MSQMQHDLIGSPVAQDYSTTIGAPFKIYLANGVTKKTNKAGKDIIEIIDLPGLIAAAVKSRVMHPRKLSGEDLKFIRSALALKSIEAARSLDMTAEHYSRCENGTKTLSSAAEKLYRMYVYLEASRRDIDICKVSKEAVLKTTDAEKVKKALQAFWKVFHEMKIQSIYPVDEELEFSFKRRECPPECEDCTDEEGEWSDQAERAAA